MNQRILYFDCLRGMAIMMVVGIHTYTISDGILPLAIRQVFNCAVPLFLAISGFFLSHKDVSNKEKYIEFIRKQVPKVYIPCLIWSLPLLFLDVVNGTFDFSSILLLFICGYSIYYFVALIIQYYLLLPFLQKIDTSKLLGLACCISVIFIVLVTYLLHFRHLQIPLIVFAGPFPLWIAFFCEGIFIGKNGRDYKLWPIVILAIISLIFAVVEARYLYSLDGGGIGVKLSSFFFSFFAVLLFFSSKTEKMFMKLGRVYKLFTWIGGLSFGIYLCHCYFVTGLGSISLPTFLNIWIVKWGVILFSSALIVAMGKKFFPWSVKYLGLR